MSGEEEHLSREELVEREHQASSATTRTGQSGLRNFAGRLKLRFWAAHPWLSSAGLHGLPGWCVTVPVPRFFL